MAIDDAFYFWKIVSGMEANNRIGFSQVRSVRKQTVIIGVATASR